MGYFIMILFVIGIDVGSKIMIHKKMKIGEKQEIVKDHFYLWHIKNKGVAYNKLEKQPQLILNISVLLLSIFGFQLYQTIKLKNCKWTSFFLSLLLGGALGNFLERLKRKSITDFLYIKLKKTPIFNIADIFIVIGSLFLILSSVFSKQK